MSCSENLVLPQVMGLVELTPLRNSLVGIPGSTGLSVEQRKRLTIAVELVANPSIIFMDEPTTGPRSSHPLIGLSEVCMRCASLTPPPAAPWRGAGLPASSFWRQDLGNVASFLLALSFAGMMRTSSREHKCSVLRAE